MSQPVPSDLVPPVPTDEKVRLAMKEIMILGEDDIPKVPEDIFTQHLLPLLTDRSGDVNLGKWLDVAGNAQSPIDVVDYEGNVLFRAPALVNTLNTHVPTSHRESMHQFLDLAELKMNQHPIAGTAFLTQGLRHKLPTTTPNMSAKAAWASILARYGYVLPGSEGVSAPTEVPSIFSGEDDEL